MAAAIFQKERHIKYFLRCLKTLLPHQYTSGDSGRVLLGFFIVAGLDLLGVLETHTTAKERQGYIDWLYYCQHPSGGFRGFTGSNFGDEKRTRENEAWDPANIPATFLALETLLILGDDLSRLEREKCLQWLPKLQRADGSFGEILGVDGEIEGGRDLRFCYCAAGIRYLLRGKRGKDIAHVADINVDELISFIESCQSYEGGFSEAPFCEAHAGLTYCALGALSFLQRTRGSIDPIKVVSSDTMEFDSLLKWLVFRQTIDIEKEDSDDENDYEYSDSGQEQSPGTRIDLISPTSKALQNLAFDDRIHQLPEILPPSEDSLVWAGFNGRCNKIADTCYCFWTTGTLQILDRLSLIDSSGNRQYLLEKTQHSIGGFSKAVGEPPDLYHAYLGLVNLALLNESGLESADATLCASTRLLRNLASIPWWRDDMQLHDEIAEGTADYLAISGG